LMQKSPNQVIAECATFDARLLTDDELQHYQADKYYAQFDAMVQFICDFRLRDYQASSIVTLSFINNEAVDCVISLGKPSNLKLYSVELEVMKVFLVSLEELYHNGRIQEEDKTGTRVYTWKKDNRTVVSFISYPPSGHPTDTGAYISLQIRDTQLHPQGGYFELLYNGAQQFVKDLVNRSSDERTSHAQRVSAAPVETITISKRLESFCRDYITALGEALDRSIRIYRLEYEAGFDEAMHFLSNAGFNSSGRNPFEFHISREDRPRILAEIKQEAELGGIPYNKLSPINQFFVAIPPYVFYCLKKYLPNDPGLREEAKRLMNTRGFPRYLQENYGYPISQTIKGAFWIPKPFGFLTRLFGSGHRH
jgi:hypothetical protein